MGAGGSNPEYIITMSKGQKSKYDQVKQIIAGWRKIRATKSIDGQTVDQFTTNKLKPCNDARDAMAGLKLQKIAAANAIKKADDAFLAAEVASRLARREVNPETGVSLEAVVALYKDRVANLNELADAAELAYWFGHKPACTIVRQGRIHGVQP
jgi:hypothetical protein